MGFTRSFIFLLYFGKIGVRLLHLQKAENCSAGTEGKLENAGRQYMYDCWRVRDRGCYRTQEKRLKNMSTEKS